MRKISPLFQVVVVVSFVAAVLICIVLLCTSAINDTRQILVTQVQEAENTPTVTEDTPAFKTYTNAAIGLRFTYPGQYRVTEEVYDDGNFDDGDFYQGDAVSVRVIDDANGYAEVFALMATSLGYELGESEGCCYIFNGTFNPASSIDAMVAAVDEQLAHVLFPQPVEVGGKNGLRFDYTTSYVSTMLAEGVIIPLDNPTYANAFFTTAPLKEYPSEATIEEIAADEENWQNSPSLGAFDAILSTVSWE